uniref:DUF7906 domain-containing protein n=1 Tax=Aegilops tauschii subsp. strangulata TaxID=200361 RepID=A0A453SBW0_AEGTS
MHPCDRGSSLACIVSVSFPISDRSESSTEPSTSVSSSLAGRHHGQIPTPNPSLPPASLHPPIDCPRRQRGRVRRPRRLPRVGRRARPLRRQRHLRLSPRRPAPLALRPVPDPPVSPPLPLRRRPRQRPPRRGSSFPPTSALLLPSFVSSAVSSSHFLSSRPPHRLAVSHSIHLDVAAPAASSDLVARAATAVQAHLNAAPAPFHSNALSSVPYKIVDDIVAEDYRAHAGSASSPAVYIYLLDLGPQPRSYAYTAASSSADGHSPAFSRCLAPLWTGKERYIWIDLGAGPVDYGPALSGEGVLPREKDPVGLDWSAIEQSIRDGDLPFDGQSLKFDLHSVKYSECSICSFAIARSTHSFTSRFLFENYTMIVSEYLDSKRMRQVLSDSSDEMHHVAGIHDDDEHDKVVPVYVFDLDFDKLLLLDRYHQAVAFRDMVVAVRTRSSQTVSDYSCNGRHVITMTRNLDRPIIGSVLQTMFGVSPTHQSWSPEHNATVVDYTWSTGHTPFGPFSETKSLSFVQKDAARRNVLLTTLNYTITSTVEVLESLAAHGGENILLRKKRHVEFIQRWNLLTYKLEKVVSAMSRLDYNKAMYLLRSSDHDMYAIYMLVYQASQELEASLVCFKDPPFPWLSVSLSGVFVFGFFLVYSKRDSLFRSKRKQF